MLNFKRCEEGFEVYEHKFYIGMIWGGFDKFFEQSPRIRGLSAEKLIQIAEKMRQL